MFAFDPTKYGAKKTGTGNISKQEIAPQNTSTQPEQPQQPQLKKPGFIGGAINDAYKTLIAKPATRFGQALASPIVSMFGNKQQKERYGQLISQDTQVPGIGFGDVNIEGVKSGTEGIKQVAGEGLKSASYLAPVPGASTIANPALRGAAGGAIGGSLYGAGNTLEEGGGAMDVVKGTLKGGAAGAVAGGILGSVAPVAKTIKNSIAPTTKYTTSAITGLNKETIETLVKHPNKITPDLAESLNRESIGTKVQTAIKSRLDDLSTTGKEYNTIRESRHSVSIPKDQNGSNSIFTTVLKKYGIDFDPMSGKIIPGPDSVPLAPGDVADLQRFYEQYGKYTDVNSNIFLNTRKALDNLADFGQDPNKTDMSNVISKELRKAYDEVGKKQIPGLKQLDTKFGPEKNLLGKIRKDYLNPDGSLKDGALNKIANLGNKGKDITLKRLEKIVPGIKEDINLLKAIEDINSPSGNKIGTYSRVGVAGLLAGTGNWPAALVSLLLSTPKISVPIIQNYGRAHRVASPLINNIINRMKLGKSLSLPMKRLVQAAFADIATEGGVKKEVPKEDNQSVDDYLNSLGI